MKIIKTGKKEWTNRHETFTQDISNLYDLANRDSGDVLADYNDSTLGIQSIIQEAIDSGQTLRILGGEWSFTKVAATEGILLNTKPLNLSFRVNAGNLSTSYAKSPEDLYFAQCGVSVQELSVRLKKRNRSLKTSGASNGQTIAGALSTGTHGSAIDVGSIPEFVTGLHIIVSPSRHVWLERETYPVVSDSFADSLNAELVRNDDIFNAALVSFGSFGFIHGVMIETDPLFLYECYRIQRNQDNELYNLMETLDFTNTTFQLPHNSERPYHFQTLINQYNSINGDYVTIMYKRPYRTDYTVPSSTNAIAPGDDTPTFIGMLTQEIPSAVPGIVNSIVNLTLKSYDNVIGTHSEIFTNTDVHGRVLSSAIGIPLNEVNHVKEIFLKLNEDHGPFCGIMAFRYVKGTKATLGFTRFETTCIFELDSVFSDASYKFYNLFWQELYNQNIPFTFHWGKLLEINSTQLRKMYGDQNVDLWIKSRNELMKDSSSMRVFTNELMRQWGLDTINLSKESLLSSNDNRYI
jgi:hypothetical protein